MWRLSGETSANTVRFWFAGSDMELDLLAAAETESDSESNHSNQDNASGRRSVVTAATAGSEAGLLFFIPRV